MKLLENVSSYYQINSSLAAVEDFLTSQHEKFVKP